LSGANTYKGSTTISAGTVNVTNNSGLGAVSSGTTVASGATLDFQNVTVGTEAITLNGGTIATSTGTSSLGGTVTMGGNSTASIGGTQLTLSGIISGSFDLTKTGNGSLILSGANSYTGATTISAGVLRASHNTALGTTAGGVTVASGAALELSGGITIGDEALTLNNAGISSGGALRNISGNNTYGGQITLSTNAVRINSDSDTLTLNKSTAAINATNINLTIGGSGNTRVSTAITTGSGSLTKDGSGTLTLSGNSSYTGLTTVSAGTWLFAAGSLEITMFLATVGESL
jgi:autotransporter-associated beta strand protein